MGGSSKLVWPAFCRDVDRAVLDVLHSGRVNYWTGVRGRAFEEEFARRLGVKRALSVSSGTTALELALAALGVGKGDDVVVTPYSFRASATCAARVGARMVFADVGRDHMLNAETVERAMTRRTKAIVVVHLYGQVADLGPIMDLAKRRGVFVVEDCAQCLGGEYRGRPVGTVGDAGCFSFCQSKHITTGGEGGMVVARNARVMKSVESLRDHGWDVGSSPKTFGRIGTNARLTELQSAVGLCELRRFDSWNMPRRRRLAEAFSRRLNGHPLVRIPPVDTPERRASFWLMPFVLDASRLSCPVASFIELLQDRGAMAYRIMWPLMSRAPVAASLARDTVGFWTHPTYTLRDVAKTLRVFEETWNEKRRAGIVV